ncbi:MAG: hypothetical protein FJ276_15955 [Planctomycetes bacterium]|nr:hypothetical protein [Planctomycetota bacterium]
MPQAAVPGAPRQLLLVIDVAVSRGGLDEASFERALLNHGIIFDGTLTADETLENSLLASRFIDSPEEKPKQLAGAEEPPATDRDAMHLVYAVSRGEQVDAVFQTLRENTEHFPLVSLDMAVVPADLDVFHHLRRATEAQWPKQFPAAGADPPRETTHTAAYRLLLSASWRGSPAARLRGTRDLKGLVPDWMLEEAAKLGPARARTDELPGGAPTPAIGAQGRDLVAEVLFVVHAHEPK